jgi:hypothetical protein
MKPDRSLTIIAEHGRKKEKARITACLIYNITGTDRLLIWFIGKTNRPACFRNKNIDSLESIGAFWRYNTKAWMNGTIMQEYLLWFDQEIRKQGKHALLLIDNFSTHESGLEQVSLTNTKVKWLPLNAISIY